MQRSKIIHRPSFTLMELLVVIALIGIMAGLAIYFVPSFNTSAKSARGAGDLQQWLNTARQRAIRDQSPRGLRILFDAAGLASKCQFLEQPDDLGGGSYFVSGTGFTSLTLQTSGPGPTYSQVTINGANFNDGSVQPKDYLEIHGTGLVHYISGVAGNVLTLQIPLQSAITTPTASFRIIRQPRVVGDETFDLPRTIVVDGNTNGTYATQAGTSSFIESLPVDASGNVDIMFSPTGVVMPGKTSKARIYLWVRSTEYTSAFDGEPTLIVVYLNSGLVASYAVNVGNASNPYDLAP